MTAPALDPGVYLVGQFIDARQGREWTGRDGITRQSYEVTLLVGRSAVRVEYRTAEDARAACGGVSQGDTVTLRVFVRATKDRAYYSGMAARPETQAA